MSYYVNLPSLTGIAGFFCLRPRRMKKRTSGMKISKASTHWKVNRQKIDNQYYLRCISDENWTNPNPVSVQWSCYKVNLSHSSLSWNSPCQLRSLCSWIRLLHRLSLPTVTYRSITSGRECEGCLVCHCQSLSIVTVIIKQCSVWCTTCTVCKCVLLPT